MLAALSLLMFLPGLHSTPPIDRDEARFAQASRQMLESVTLPREQLDPAMHAGGLAVPMVQSKQRLKKPPLIYWAQCLSVWALTGGDVLDDAIWMYRIPSVLGAMSAVLGVWWMGRRMFDPRAAFLAGALLATSTVVVFDAHQARSDQVLLGATTWAMALLWDILRRAHRGERIALWRWLVLWLVVGVGVLAKGLTPMVVVFTLASMGVLEGRWWAWRAAKPLLGLLVALGVVLPWVLGVAAQVGLDTYLSVLHDEVIARGGGAKEGHSGPPGYYFLSAALAFWPGGALAIFGVWWGIRRAITLGPKGRRWAGRRTHRAPEVFLLSWLLPMWVFFEIYATKLPHYTLPVYPALALLCARAALSGSTLLKRWPARVSIVGFGAVGTLVPIGLIAASATMPELMPPLWQVAPLALLALAITLAATRLFWLGRGAGAVCLALAGAVPITVLVHAVVMPSLTSLSPGVYALIEDNVGQGRPVAATGYAEDSLVFLMRGGITKLQRAEADEWLGTTPGALLVCRAQDREALTTPVRILGSVTGLHFARGKTITVELVERAR